MTENEERKKEKSECRKQNAKRRNFKGILRLLLFGLKKNIHVSDYIVLKIEGRSQIFLIL